MQTEARFRYATEWEREAIPARSYDGTLYVDFSDPHDVKLTITAPQPVNKGQVDLTLELARELVAQILAAEKIIEANAKSNRRDAA